MEKLNIKKHVDLLIYALAGMLMYSCSGEEIALVPTPNGTEHQTTLSVSLNAPQEGKLRSSGNPDKDAESKVYSLEVLVFRSAGEFDAGKRDGYGCEIRKVVNSLPGLTYDKEYQEIDRIEEVEMTAGKRDIYVVANAPDNYFKFVMDINSFFSKCEELSRQGLLPHPPGTINPNPDDNPPIGGINPSDLKTNLTMCNYIKDVNFSKQHDHHYLGYTTDPGNGWLIEGTNPFHIERLVARVAINRVEFDLPTKLPFEVDGGITYYSENYNYQVDSVFMMNAKTTSKFTADSPIGFTEKFGHGCDVGYSFLKQPGYISNLNPQSQQADFLMEPITTPYYDIAQNATPLWFYTFENNDTTYPTYLIIGVRYNFQSKIDNTIRTVKSYYQVVVNEPKGGKQTDHDYIKRNHQYQIAVKIKGLGSMYGNNSTLLRSAQASSQNIEITETVGQNLFPWTGNTYKQNK